MVLPAYVRAGTGGRMAQVPRVRVQALDLHGEAPVVLYDDQGEVRFGIDTTATPEDIAAALQGVMQDAVDSGRWHRRGLCEQYTADQEAAPHPEDDL